MGFASSNGTCRQDDWTSEIAWLSTRVPDHVFVSYQRTVLSFGISLGINSTQISSKCIALCILILFNSLWSVHLPTKFFVPKGFECGLDVTDQVNHIVADIGTLEWEKINPGTAYVVTSRAKTIGVSSDTNPYPIDSALFFDCQITIHVREPNLPCEVSLFYVRYQLSTILVEASMRACTTAWQARNNW